MTWNAQIHYYLYLQANKIVLISPCRKLKLQVSNSFIRVSMHYKDSFGK